MLTLKDSDVDYILKSLDNVTRHILEQRKVIESQKVEIERLQELLDDKCDRCIERETHNGMKIMFDRLDKCLSFGATDGVYVSMNDIDKIKKDLTGED